MIKLRYYCQHCLERREAEIIFDEDGGLFVKVNGKRVIQNPRSPMILSLESPLICPTCNRTIDRYKIIRDPPERILRSDGWLDVRKYEDIK